MSLFALPLFKINTQKSHTGITSFKNKAAQSKTSKLHPLFHLNFSTKNYLTVSTKTVNFGSLRLKLSD